MSAPDLRPSYINGFARNAGLSDYPGIWTGLRCLTYPCLGFAGDRIVDQSGRRNDAIWSGTGNHRAVDGFGAMAVFNGTDDFLTIRDKTKSQYGIGTFDSQTFTIFGDVKDMVTADTTLFSYDYTSHDGVYYAAHVRNNGGTAVLLGWNDGTSYQFTQVTANMAGNHKIVATFRSGRQEIWIDGISQGSSARTDTITFYSQSVWIGKANFGISKAFSLRRFAFWNRVLNQSEIQLLQSNPDCFFIPRRRIFPTATITFRAAWAMHSNKLVA